MTLLAWAEHSLQPKWTITTSHRKFVKVLSHRMRSGALRRGAKRRRTAPQRNAPHPV